MHTARFTPIHFSLKSDDLPLFSRLTVLHLLYVLPILLADYLFNDDLGRSYTGGTGWNADGRPLTQLLQLFLGGGEPLSDTAPLPLLLCAPLLAYALTIYVRTNVPRLKKSWILTFGLFGVMACPFLLENLSYRFDCITMVLAVSLSLLLFSLPDDWRLWQTCLLSTIAGAALMCIYQPIIGMAPCLCLIALLLWLLGERPAFTQYRQLFGMGIGLGLYLFVIAPRFLGSGTWQQDAGRISVLGNLSGNVRKLIPVIMNVLTGIPWLYRLCFLAVWLLGWAFTAHDIYRRPGKARLLKTLFALALPGVVGLVAILPVLVLSGTAPASRVLISLCALMLLLGILLALASQHCKHLLAALLIPCVLFQFSYVYSYGTTLMAQKDYNTMLAYNIARDFETLNADGQTYPTISFLGQPRRANKVRLACEKYPQFSQLISPYFSNSFWQGGGFLLQYLHSWVDFQGISDEEFAAILSMEPTLNNHYYACYVLNDKVIVSFK